VKMSGSSRFTIVIATVYHRCKPSKRFLTLTLTLTLIFPVITLKLIEACESDTLESLNDSSSH